MSYYGGRQPHLKRKDDELYHSGKAGMRWGISNNPLYKAVGKIAKFTMVNGKKVYDSARELINGGKSRDAYNEQRDRVGRMLSGNMLSPSGFERADARVTDYKNKADEAFNRSLAGRAKSAIDSAGRWAGGLADKIKERGQSAGNWLKERGRGIRDLWNGGASEEDYNNKRDYIQDQIKQRREGGSYPERVAERDMEDLHNLAKKAHSARENSIVGRAKSAGKWLKDRGREFKETVSRAAGNAGNWAKERGKELQGTAGRAGKFIGDRATEFKDTVGRAAGAAGNWAKQRGKELQGTAGRAGKFISDRGREFKETVSRAAGNAGNWAKERGKELQGTAGRAGKAIREAAGTAGNWAKQRGKELQGTAGRAGKFIGDRATEFKDTVGRAAGAAGKFVKDRATEFQGTVKRAGEAIGNFKDTQVARAENWNDQRRVDQLQRQIDSGKLSQNQVESLIMERDQLEDQIRDREKKYHLK